VSIGCVCCAVVNEGTEIFQISFFNCVTNMNESLTGLNDIMTAISFMGKLYPFKIMHCAGQTQNNLLKNDKLARTC